MKLSSGSFNGVSNLKRYGDIIIQFTPPQASSLLGIYKIFEELPLVRPTRIVARICLDELNGRLNYTGSTFFGLVKPKGMINVTVKKIMARIGFNLDLYQLKITDPEIKIENLG